MRDIDLSEIDAVDIERMKNEDDEHAEKLIAEYITPYIEEVIDYFYPDLMWDDVVKFFRKVEK